MLRIQLSLAACLALFAEGVTAEVQQETLVGDIERGAESYGADCAECHATPARIVQRVPGDDDAARADWLEDFLPRHFAPDARTRRDIIDYMLSL